MKFLLLWLIGSVICSGIWMLLLAPRRRERRQREQFRRYLVRLEQFDVQREPSLKAYAARERA